MSHRRRANAPAETMPEGEGTTTDVDPQVRAPRAPRAGQKRYGPSDPFLRPPAHHAPDIPPPHDAIGNWEHNLRTGHLEWSDATLRIFGITRSEFSATVAGFLAKVHPEDRPALIEAQRKAAATLLPVAMEYRLVRPDGELRMVHDHGEYTLGPDGTPLRLTGVVIDITERRKQEQRSEDRQAMLRMATGLVHLGAWAVELPGRKLTWSEEVSGIHELGPEAAPSLEEALAFYAPEYRATVRAAVWECMEHGTGFATDAEIITARGHRVWVGVIGKAERDGSGAVRRVQGSMQDITDRKQAETVLRDREASLREAQRIAHIGSWELRMDDQRLSWSDEVFRIFGVDPANFASSFQSFLSFVHPDDRSAMIAAHQQALTGKVPMDFEHRIVRPNGEIRHVRERGGQLPADAIRPNRLTGTVQDITDQHFAEEARRTSEERFRQLAENIHEVFWLSSPAKHEIVYVSPGFETIWGRPCAELYRSPELWEQSIHPDDRARVVAAVTSGMAAGAYNEEYRILRPDGVIRWISDRAVPVRDGTGQVYRIAGVAQDITERYLAQEATRRLAEGLASTLESITDAFYTLDRMWRFTYVNHEAERLMQRSRDAMVGRVVWELFPDAQGSEFQIQFERAAAQQVAVQFEGFYPPLGGWFEVRAFPSTQGLAVYFRDISDQHRNREELRRSEEALRQRTEQLQLALRGAGMGVWRWDLQSHSLTTLQGGGPVSSLPDGLRPTTLTEFGALIHPDDRAAVEEHVRRAVATAEPYRAEFRVVLPDRGARWVSALGQCARDNAGNPVVMIGVDQDITERKNAEQAFAQQAALIDEARDAIQVGDLDHRVVFWSKGAERLYGWTAAEAKGRHFAHLLRIDAARFHEAEQLVLEKGHWSGELRKSTKAGAQLTLDCRWTLLRDPQGRPKSVLAIDTNITERKTLEQQFLRAQRMESIGTLAGGIAHDLNNVLTPILLAIELLRSDVDEGERQDLLSTIATSAKHGAEMVRQMLTFARGVEGERIVVQVAGLVAEIERIIRDTFPKNVRASFRLAPELWTVIGDPTQLHQILLNLCVNARDAMPGGGTLTLSAENATLDAQYAEMNLDARSGSFVVIQVEDSGGGMSRDVLDRVFDPFFTTKGPGKGTGLGLSTSLAIAKSHGGFIRVDSEPEGGTRFRIYLPAEPGAPAAVRHLAKASPPPRGNGELVLVVDDEASVRQVTRQTLEAYGYRVLLASDGAEAVGLYTLHRKEIAAVLTDMIMPIMDGPATIRVLLKMDPGVRIIAASGLTESMKTIRGVGAGVRHFLAKPYTAEVLLTVLKRVLEEPA